MRHPSVGLRAIEGRKMTINRRIGACLLVSALLLVVMLAMASTASANVTKFKYVQTNTNAYSFTPTWPGTPYPVYTVSLKWWKLTDPESAWSAGYIRYPDYECDVMVQFDNGSDTYKDADISALYDGQNGPTTWAMDMKSYQALNNQPVYLTVCGFANDVNYRLTVVRTRTGDPTTTVLDQTGIARGAGGVVWLDTPGDWLSVMQDSKGVMGATPETTSNVYVNWDDYMQVTDPAIGSHLADFFVYSWVTNWQPDGIEPNNAGNKGGRETIAAQDTGKLYMPVAQAWGGAYRNASAPWNVWQSGGPYNYPKPGTVGWTDAAGAPLYYTYSFPTSTSAITNPKIGYFFSPVESDSASLRSYSADTGSTSTIHYKFYGSSVDWVFPTNPLGTTVTATIDGLDPSAYGPKTIDQSSAAPVWNGLAQWTGMSSGWHTLDLVSTGLKGAFHSSASNVVYMTHDYFNAKHAPDTPPYADDMRSENNLDGSTSYVWPIVASASADGGFYAASTSGNAAFGLTFQGTGVRINYPKNPLGGWAKVRIDGLAPSANATIDMSANPTTWGNVTSWTGLTNTTHTIMVLALGTKGAAHLASPNVVYTCLDYIEYQDGSGWHKVSESVWQ